jgi:UDP-4-amino-4,6-dideoxy-N-acetyl-beta-L-altrosamine N-acetyltransferase
MIDTCRVRPAHHDDLPMLLFWRNHPNVRTFMFSQHEIGFEEHAAWFAKANQDTTRSLLVVEDRDQPLGYVQFANVAPGGIADWGFYARPEAPRGSGRKLGRAALDHAFTVLGLHKVCGQAIASNAASIALHQKLHFRQEGVLRDQQRIEGAYYSLVCFGLLKHEWFGS